MKTQKLFVLILASATLTLGACAASGPHRSTGQVVDDTTIAGRIKTELLADSTTDGLNIDVEVDRDKVQLNGFVDSQAQVDRAGQIARATPGVTAVDNQLKISGGDRMAGEYIDDTALSVSVKTALASDAVAPASEIDVEVSRGIVSLGGYVDSNAQRDAAMAAARNVKGVKSVVNNLTVR
jgi:osmotically-inducible protein OsmY